MTSAILGLLFLASSPSTTRHCVAMKEAGFVPYVTVAKAYARSASWGWSRQSICCKCRSSSAIIICRNIFSMSAVNTYWCFRNLVRMEKMFLYGQTTLQYVSERGTCGCFSRIIKNNSILSSYFWWLSDTFKMCTLYLVSILFVFAFFFFENI